MNTSIHINELEQTGLIRLAQMEPELEYLFRHALVQEAAYDSILKADRKKLHLAVAGEIERLYPERLDEFAALLANHYKEAGEKQKALEYYKRAAQSAFQKFANREAEYNLRAALEICSNEDERAELCYHMGIAVQALGRLDESEKFLRDSLPAYRASNNLEKIAEIYCSLSQIAWGKNNVSNYLAVAREGLSEVGDLPPSEAYAELLRYVANGCLFNDLLDEAENYISKALAAAEQSGSKAALAQALVTQGTIEDRRDKSEQALVTLQRAAALGEQAKHPLSVSRARNNIAYVLVRLGRNAEAAEQYEAMVAYNRKVNSIFGELWFLAQLCDLYLSLGKIDAAIELGAIMEDLLKASGGKTYRIQVQSSRLQTLIYIGRSEEAISDLTTERDYAFNHNDKQMFMNLSYALALAYVTIKDYDRAAQAMEYGIQSAGVWAGSLFLYLLAGLQARAQEDVSTAQKSFERGEQANGANPNFATAATRLYALMHIRAREENFNEALSIAEELAEKYRAVQYRWLYTLILWESGEIALKARNITKAKELLQQALSEYQEMNISIYAAQIHEILNTL